MSLLTLFIPVLKCRMIFVAQSCDLKSENLKTNINLIKINVEVRMKLNLAGLVGDAPTWFTLRVQSTF